ncbi:MAG: ATP-dependent metallopeptidase FtsH/Yme1/Tma family protein, partial [Solibacillus sp.]
MNRIFRYTIFYLLIFLVIIGIFGTFNGGKKTTEEMSFYEFFEALDSKKVESITMQPDNKVYKVVGQLKGAKEGETFTVNILENDTDSIKSIMQIEKDYPEVIVKEAPQTSGFVTFITSMIPFVIIIILFFFLLSQSQGGGNKVMNFGKSKAKLYDD